MGKYEKDIKTSILLDEQSDDDSGWNEFFITLLFLNNYEYTKET